MLIFLKFLFHLNFAILFVEVDTTLKIITPYGFLLGTIPKPPKSINMQ